MKNLWILLVLGFVSGCFDFKEKGEIHTNKIRKGRVEEGISFTVAFLKGDEVSSRTFVTSVQAGDTIQIKVQGYRDVPKFLEYTDVFKSSWLVEECHSSIYVGADRCRDKKKYGRCNLLYRKKDNNPELIIFENEESYPLRFTLGEMAYPLENVTLEGGWVTAELSVKEEMLEGGDDLYLDTLPEESLGEVRIGFLSYKKCNGLGEKGFYVSGPTNSEIVQNTARNIFRVFVGI